MTERLQSSLYATSRHVRRIWDARLRSSTACWHPKSSDAPPLHHFSTHTPRRSSHENPLGLPRSGTPPNLRARMTRGLPEKRPLPNVRKVVAVTSCKGGVGKSTISANLALAFARQGRRTGILDADIFGPSIPTLFGLSDAGEPRLSTHGRLLPLTNYGVATMSMGYLGGGGEDAPVAWRGLMVMKALQQLLWDVEWAPGLDVLVLDLPPGTGDTQLTIAQQVVVDGAVVVSTPQTLALSDTAKGIGLLRATNIPILGLVNNMSAFVCPCCGEATGVFGGRDKALALTQRLGVQVLADVPLDARVCEDADVGRPTVVSEPESERAKVFIDLAARVAEDIGL